MIYASYNNLFKELKNSINKRFLSYLSKQYFDCLIHNLKAWPIEISIPFLTSLDNLL